MHHYQCIGAFEAPQSDPHGVGEIALVGILHEMSHNFRVRLGS